MDREKNASVRWKKLTKKEAAAEWGKLTKKEASVRWKPNIFFIFMTHVKIMRQSETLLDYKEVFSIRNIPTET
ncbi:hypothetical protein RCL_jg1038.t1 [Rhizophagus clarus]|uniref:Uncharacterized protein n=1 Tax=Rhizophagus clarus TaxID=94130 RepID=A0A8H3R256_9GLOM|nr:hypothetical protein RCL_jg1038.t1 [Rhizophagus clarus]